MVLRDVMTRADMEAELNVIYNYINLLTNTAKEQKEKIEGIEKHLGIKPVEEKKVVSNDNKSLKLEPVNKK